MQLRKLFCLCSITICIAIATMTPSSVDASDQRGAPNILLLFTDDQCFDTIAELGHPEVITPNLDQLARQGVAFRNAYNMGGWNGAICVASRTMMNTGRFIWDAYPLDNKQSLSEEVEHGRMLSLQLRNAGYETYMSGKWHVKADAHTLFDHVENVRPGMPKDTPASYGRPSETDQWLPWDPKQKGFWQGGKHWSEVLADDAIGFLENAASSDKPFFMYLAFNAPHDPRQSPREYVEMYDRDALSIPDNFLPQYPFMEQMGAGKSLRDERLAPWPRTPAAVQLHRQEYFALITHLDAQIGKILTELRQQGLADNTYIVMTADHGLACGQHGLLGKQSMYEHSMKAPLIVVGPDIPKNKRVDTPVYVQDFHPTALQWAGAQKPKHVQFRSLLPIINGERDSQYDVVYGAYRPNKQRMIRSGDFKLIHYPEGDTYRLFDLASDPHEQHDLASKPEHANTLAALKKELLQLMKEMSDPMLETTREAE